MMSIAFKDEKFLV